MDAERIVEIIKSDVMTADKSSLDGCCLFDGRVLLMAIRDAAYEITTELEGADESKPEPPEPPKTVLPDMSDAERGKSYWFFAEDGTQVEYFHINDGDCKSWRLASFGNAYRSAEEFIALHPHLGRLREAIPGGLA